MNIHQINPSIRFAGYCEYSFTRNHSKTYDCRLLYVLDGKGKITIETHEYIINAGLFILFQPGIEYSLLPEKFFTAIAVDFDYTKEYNSDAPFLLPVSTEDFSEALSHKIIYFEDCEVLNRPIIINKFFLIEELLKGLVSEFNSSELYCRETAENMLKVVLYRSLRQISSNPFSNDIELVKKYIYDNFSKKITNEQLGRIFNYNPSYLNRVFHKVTNTTIHQFLINHRLNVGINLLLTTNMSINEISTKIGFYDETHFASCMKKHLNKLPSMYRK